MAKEPTPAQAPDPSDQVDLNDPEAGFPKEPEPETAPKGAAE